LLKCERDVPIRVEMDVLDRLLVALSGLLVAAAAVGVVAGDWFLFVCGLVIATNVAMYVRPVRQPVKRWLRRHKA
jgi:hypothetical protein